MPPPSPISKIPTLRILQSAHLKVLRLRIEGAAVEPLAIEDRESTPHFVTKKIEMCFNGIEVDRRLPDRNSTLQSVEKIPLTFRSEEHYFRSFVYLLLEETRTELASSMKMMYRSVDTHMVYEI
ncbi:hypothetical protein L1887_39013 [Cichorium endivia]|nr:hypothetical protein L1887_39013 [Cichorium endivia]